jgi:predicted Zn-dependent protease
MVLKRIVDASQISDRLSTPYGVCLTPIEEPNGMFAFLTRGPRLDKGIINVPPKFLFELGQEDEIAFVIAHELSHFLLKHEILYAYYSGSGRSLDEVVIETEREADELAMRLILNAGYDIDKAILNMKTLREKDSSHFVGSQLQDMRNIVMTDLQIANKVYAPMASQPYLGPDVLRELNAYLSPKTADGSP